MDGTKSKITSALMMYFESKFTRGKVHEYLYEFETDRYVWQGLSELPNANAAVHRLEVGERQL